MRTRLLEDLRMDEKALMELSVERTALLRFRKDETTGGFSDALEW